MIEDKIAASLDNVNISEDRKNIVLRNLLKRADAQRESQERRMPMKRRKLGLTFGAIAAFAVIAAAVLAAYPLLTNDYPEVSNNDEQPQGVIVQNTPMGETPSGEGADGGEGTVPLTDLEIIIEYTQPSCLYVAKQSCVQFTEEDMKTVIKNLEANGWENVSGRLSNFRLNFSQPETYDYSVHGKKDEVPNFSATEKHVEYAQQFLVDSGIIELLRGHGIELSDQPKNEHTTLFYGSYEGYRTQTYLRLHFSPDGTLEDAQLYAVSLEGALLTESILPLEEAIRDAFYSSECSWMGDYKYSITGVEVVYISGLPFYELELSNEQSTMIGYTLAVDYSEIESDEEIKKVFDDLMSEGIW